MSNDKNLSSNWLSSLTIIWRLLLVVVVVLVIIIGAYWMTPISVKKAENHSWVDWAKSGETQATTTIDKKGKNQKITINEQIYSAKTLWDILDLSSELAIPILLFYFGYQFLQIQKKRAEQQAELENQRVNAQAELEKGIAKDNLSEEAIQVYLERVTDLLLNKELRQELFADDQSNSSDNDNPGRDVARIITITILRRLEGDEQRQARILNFLRDAELDKFIFKNANLLRVNLKKVNLELVNLKEAYLDGANLERANLSGANLSGASLEGTNLERASLEGANLSGAYLWKAKLKRASLKGANLEGTNLEGSNLGGANLGGTNLKGADLEEANLEGANFTDAQHLTHKQIKSACFWQKAIYKKDESENEKYIEKLKTDKSSDPKELPDCSIWQIF